MRYSRIDHFQTGPPGMDALKYFRNLHGKGPEERLRIDRRPVFRFIVEFRKEKFIRFRPFQFQNFPNMKCSIFGKLFRCPAPCPSVHRPDVKHSVGFQFLNGLLNTVVSEETAAQFTESES